MHNSPREEFETNFVKSEAVTTKNYKLPKVTWIPTYAWRMFLARTMDKCLQLKTTKDTVFKKSEIKTDDNYMS